MSHQRGAVRVDLLFQERPKFILNQAPVNFVARGNKSNFVLAVGPQLHHLSVAGRLLGSFDDSFIYEQRNRSGGADMLTFSYGKIAVQGRDDDLAEQVQGEQKFAINLEQPVVSGGENNLALIDWSAG